MELGDREFTSEEVAALCGVTRVTVADWIARGKLSVRWTAGGHRRIPRASLAEFMARQGYAVPRIVENPRALVLLLDDELEWRGRVEADLERTGDMDVEALPPGMGALLSIGARAPDALLIDTRMPGFDTRQLFEAIRREPGLAETIVIALTTHDEEGPAVKRFGADAALPKQRVAELHDLLVRILSERQRRASGGASGAELEEPRAPRAPAAATPEGHGEPDGQ